MLNPLYCFGFVSFPKVFMLCLVRNIVQLCCVLCYVQNVGFFGNRLVLKKFARFLVLLLFYFDGFFKQFRIWENVGD